MATSTTRKTSQTTRFAVTRKDGTPTDYTVEIIAGKSITIEANKVVRREKTDNWRMNYFGPAHVADRDSVLAWFAVQGQTACNELAALIQERYALRQGGRAGDSVVGDWLEDRGVDRRWADHMNCFQIENEIRETTTITYGISDQAEHSSYNLSYTGPITSITAKTVTIADRHDASEVRRLTIEQFCSRNWDGMAPKLERNRNWSD